MKTTKNVSELSTVELKALGYDLIADIEAFRNNLKVVNDELTLRDSKEPEEIKEVDNVNTGI